MRARTDPTFRLNWTYEDECISTDKGGEGEGEGEGEFSADAGVGGDVTVLQQGPIGPYWREVIQSDDAQALLTWLEVNEYDIPEVSIPEIQSYVNAGYVFLALRLLKDRSVGDLTPIVIRVPEEAPCIPLRLTAIAAMADMPIYAWVLAEGRVVSTNFLDVVPNLAALDWLSGGSNYEDLVRRAVDEATGQSFVTEYAGPSQVLDRAFFWPGRYDIDVLRGLDDPVQFVNELIAQGFSANSQLLALLQRFIPKPEELADVDEQSFYNCLDCYRDALVGLDFSADEFADAIQEVIVDPLVAAQDMVGRHETLTRLHTTISPAEMTDDPVFRFNLDLGEVSNEHVAEALEMCRDGEEWSDHLVRLTLPDGRVIVTRRSGPQPAGDEDMPASERATLMSESGPGEVQYDNSDAIAGIIDGRYGLPAGYGDARSGVAGGGCSIAAAGGGAVLMAGLALPLVLRRRSRKRD